MSEYPRTVWRYDFRLEFEGTDQTSLQECLEAEDLAMFETLPREEVYRQMGEGVFVFRYSFDEPMIRFPQDLATISAFVFQIVTGTEMAERHVAQDNIDDVRAWKVIARQGEWVKVPLVVVQRDDGAFEVDRDREDLEVIRARWGDYQGWFKDGMRFRYPELREI